MLTIHRPPISVREKELFAQQADIHYWDQTAASVRCYLRTGPVTAADVVRMQVIARNFGWTRLPGWHLLDPYLGREGRRAVHESYDRVDILKSPSSLDGR